MGKLGYSSITLTDLTETLPVFLTLESNLSNNIQKKNGSLYTPNFEDGDGVIITPSLFVGSELKEFSKGDLCYIVDGTEYSSEKKEVESNKITINDQGQLVIKENIDHSYEISAFINNFKIEEHGYTTNVKSRNKISIFVLEESSSYTAIISSSRDHFDENNTDKITLTAQFYRGTDEVTDATYDWDGLTDNDNSSDDSNISGVNNTLDISRGQINGTEVISCIMTDNNTGLSFVATKTIRDYVDEYRADLLPSSSLILTPNNSSVDLTARVWHKTSIINKGHTFSYEWKLIKSDGTFTTLSEKTDSLNIDTTSTFPKENFTITCTITIDGKTTASAYQNITYSPIEYTINVEPKQAWLNVDSEGNYSGTRTFNFNFQLLDKEKNLVPKEESDGVIASDSHWSFTSKNDDFWDYVLTLTLNAEEDSLDDSNIFEFEYQYLGNDFLEEVYVIKNYAGKDGTNGASYTIDLSNSFHTFAGEQAHAIAGQIVSFQIQAYYGDDELTIKKVSWEDAPSGLEIKYDKTTKTVTLTTQSGDFLTKDGNIIFTITVEKKEGVDTLDFIKIFNYSINYNGKSYYLGFGDNNTITYSPSTQTYNPSSIIVKAYSRNINGEASVYTDGIIYYSFDRENWVKLTEEDISNYSNINNIYIRLYSPLMKPSLSLENNRAYLLDEETIPVLTSLDGVEIGGDNLLRWTKTMPIETNKWSLYSVDSTDTDKIYQEQEGDFNSIVFDHSAFWSYVFSPKEKINKEYSDKTFCFSCYVYFDEEIPIISQPILGAQLRLYSNFSDSFTARRFHKKFAALSSGVTTYPTFISKEEIVANKWIKIYQTFTWNNFIPENPEDPIAPEDCKYFSIALLSGADDNTNKRTVKIKKPKLEIGNVPTEWSASPYDITYDNIIGMNLVSPTSYIWEITGPNPGRKIIVDHLEPNTSYTVSFKTSSFSGINNNNFNICVLRESDSEITNTLTFLSNSASRQQETFTTPIEKVNYQLYVYAGLNSEISLINGTLRITELKVEEGFTATDFFITENYLNSLITNVQSIQSQLDNQVTILTSDGNAIKTDINNLRETISGLSSTYVSINNLEGEIEAANERIYPAQEGEQGFGDYFAQLRGNVKISAKDADDPFLEIKVSDAGSSYSTKLTANKLSFMNNANEVAYISDQELFIKNAKFLNSFKIGDLTVSVTEAGVGFSW